VLRLMIYALPYLYAFALFALDRVVPHRSPPPAPLRASPRTRLLLLGALALAVAFPFVALDRYRRVEFRPVRDGPLVLAVCHESLRTAEQLQAGRSVRWDLDEPGYVPGDSESAVVQRVHWFLWSGWRALPAAEGAVEMSEPHATLLLPSFAAEKRELVLRLAGAPGEVLQVAVNGIPAARIALRAAPADYAIAIAAESLFRGDNQVTLTRSSQAAAPRLSRIVVRPT
jgi:hypothetical protein